MRDSACISVFLVVLQDFRATSRAVHHFQCRKRQLKGVKRAFTKLLSAIWWDFLNLSQLKQFLLFTQVIQIYDLHRRMLRIRAERHSAILIPSGSVGDTRLDMCVWPAGASLPCFHGFEPEFKKLMRDLAAYSV